MGRNMVPLQRCAKLYLSQQHLPHAVGSMSVPDGPFRLWIGSFMSSPPPVFTVESHVGRIGTAEPVEQKKRGRIAVETGPCSLSTWPHPLLYPHVCVPPPFHFCPPQLSSILYPQMSACNAVGAGGT